MKRFILISTIAGVSLVAACGGQEQSVSRNEGGLLDMVRAEPEHAGYSSSRSSLDLLSFR